MRMLSVTFVATAALVLLGCQPEADQTQATAPTAAQQAWPESLRVVGDGFPNPGDPCRIIGETAATIDYLDDSATLAGCLSAEEAAALGGRHVETVDGVTLVSVPHAPR